MIRAVVYLLIAILLITVIRMIVGVVLKGIGQAMSSAGNADGSAPPRAPNAPASGELKRDPVCGTFVPVTTSYRKTVGAESYYFCSADCRDKYV